MYASKWSSSPTSGRALATFVGLLLFANPAESKEGQSTSNDVYRVVEGIVSELKDFHQANDSEIPKGKDPGHLLQRQPRHVLQKAREVFLKVQQLRRINGLSPELYPAAPLGEVRSADVLRRVHRIRDSLRALRSPFGVRKPYPNIAKRPGMTSAEVFVALAESSRLLDGLGVPRTVPNDEYRIATTIKNGLVTIGTKRGMPSSPRVRKPSKGKTHRDVYERAEELLAALSILTANDADFLILGSAIPYRPSGTVRPSHIMNILNILLAEVSAIKAKLRIAAPTRLAPPQAGRTPSNVYDEVSAALDLVDSLK